ncbi:MAG: HAD family hydrolase [Nocardioidaceae bacterium]|nr:HAD family hydrolase [Nocardioidaceae bacterium]NUS52156.1 HAD family hydrolase [Nocardioidaceae bacterium]
MPLLMCDLDDTLVVRPPIFRAWAEAFLAERGRPDLLAWVVEQDGGGHRPREEFLAAVAAETGYDAPPDRFRREYDAQVADRYRTTPDTRQALASAREHGWSIAIVTNGPTAGQGRKVRAAGLGPLVDAVCISEEVGVRKPDPVIFETAAERAGSTLDGAWMVGDSLDADVAGAHAVGASAAWLPRAWDPLEHTSGARPELVSESFAEAVGAILASRPAPGRAPASG